MPTIVIAHTFFASRDTRISYRWCLLIQGYFCAAQNYAGKAELSQFSWYPKRKLGVIMHFSGIIKLQFGKECHALLCILQLLTNIVDLLSSKNAWLPPLFFLDSITLVKICFSRMFSKPCKNIFELVAWLHLKTELMFNKKTNFSAQVLQSLILVIQKQILSVNHFLAFCKRLCNT